MLALDSNLIHYQRKLFMSDSVTTINQAKAIIQEFCKQRGWDKLNSPKDLSADIVSEATELMDIFLFVQEAELKNTMSQKKRCH